MIEDYFPHPKTPADLVIPGPGEGLFHAELMALLGNSQQEQWRHKTGVVGAQEGSAKHNLRLVLSGGWVLKTHADGLFTTEAEAIGEVCKAMALATRLGVWHPRKTWFVVRTDAAWWACTATPRLTILRELPSWPEKVDGWCAMLHLALRIILAENVLLDINPSNFGYDGAGDRLYYIDEETYTPGDVRDVGEAIAHRLPQEAEATAEEWRLFGQRLGTILRPLLPTAAVRKALIDALCDYPLTPRYIDDRQALLAGLQDLYQQRALPPRRTNKVAIISDIHGNLPALEAVLGEIRRLGADSYLVLGDVVGYGPHPRQCLEIVANLPNATYLRGNHDHVVGSGLPEDGMNSQARAAAEWTRSVLSEAECRWLTTLPLEHFHDRWMMVHGSPQDPHRFFGYVYEMTFRSNLALIKERGWSVAFHGHNHIQFIYMTTANGDYIKHLPASVRLFQPGENLLLNPGSVGQPRDGDPRAAFALWDQADDTVQFHRVPYAIAETMEAILRIGLPELLAHRLELGR